MLAIPNYLEQIVHFAKTALCCSVQYHSKQTTARPARALSTRSRPNSLAVLESVQTLHLVHRRRRRQQRLESLQRCAGRFCQLPHVFVLQTGFEDGHLHHAVLPRGALNGTDLERGAGEAT